jgi:hypothetical protein
MEKGDANPGSHPPLFFSLRANIKTSSEDIQ